MPWDSGLPDFVPWSCLYCKQLKLEVLPGYPSVTETEKIHAQSEPHGHAESTALVRSCLQTTSATFPL